MKRQTCSRCCSTKARSVFRRSVSATAAADAASDEEDEDDEDWTWLGVKSTTPSTSFSSAAAAAAAALGKNPANGVREIVKRTDQEAFNWGSSNKKWLKEFP